MLLFEARDHSVHRRRIHQGCPSVHGADAVSQTDQPRRSGELQTSRPVAMRLDVKAGHQQLYSDR